MFSSTISTINADLTKTERSALRFMVAGLLGKDPKLKQEALNLLDQWTPGKIVRYAAKNKKLQHLFETNPALQERWRLELMEKGCANIPLHDSKTDEKISLFEIYCAQYFTELFDDAMSTNQKDDRAMLLSMACELGSFKALRIRCNLDIEIIKKPTSMPNDPYDLRVNQIKNDTERLCGLYHACGYVASGLILNNLSACYLYGIDDVKKISAHPEYAQKTKLEPNREQGLAYYHEAIKCFLCAWLLRQNKVSNQLITSMTKELGLSGLTHKSDTFNFSSWDKTLMQIRNHISKETYDIILQRARAEISLRYSYLSHHKSMKKVR